jgi:chorismate mutase
MSDQRPTADDDKLAQVREEIDALDREILEILEKRMAIAAEVAKAKSGHQVFRPGREADLLRKLIFASSLSPHLIERIWRQIIASNLVRQMDLKIGVLNSPTILAATDFRFGLGAVKSYFDSDNDVVAAVSTGQCDLGLVPHWNDGGGWLDALLRTHNKGQQGMAVYINTVTPLLKDHGIDDAVILATALPDPSEADMTLMIDKDSQSITSKDGYHPQMIGVLGMIQKRDLS